jgi:hypothetical protein
MLFSILIGAAATLYFLARTLLIKLKVVLSGGISQRNKADYPCVVYSEGAQYWNVFKPVLDEFEKREISLVYYTSSRDDPVFSRKYRFVKSEFIGEGNTAFARLNFLSAEILLMTTPGLDVYQLKRSKTVGHYAHILHMPNDSATYRLFGLDYFDSVLLTGDYQADDIRFLETLRRTKRKELVTVGCTYLDVYAEKIRELNTPRPDISSVRASSVPGDFTVLVSPSWGKSGLLLRYGEALLDPLVKTGKHVIIRPHPQSKKTESEMLIRLKKRYGVYPSVEWDFENENIISLSRADIMVSDFSGIIFDFIFLCDKPILYASAGMDMRPYDASDLNHELWQMKALRESGVELREEDFPRIGEVIQGAAEDPSLKEARRRAKNTAWQYPGEAGKRAADFILTHVKQ